MNRLPARVQEKAGTHLELIAFAVVGMMAFIVDTVVFFHPQVHSPAFQPGHGQNHRHTAGHDRLLCSESAVLLPVQWRPGNAPRGCAVPPGTSASAVKPATSTCVSPPDRDCSALWCPLRGPSWGRGIVEANHGVCGAEYIVTTR